MSSLSLMSQSLVHNSPWRHGPRIRTLKLFGPLAVHPVHRNHMQAPQSGAAPSRPHAMVRLLGLRISEDLQFLHSEGLAVGFPIIGTGLERTSISIERLYGSTVSVCSDLSSTCRCTLCKYRNMHVRLSSLSPSHINNLIPKPLCLALPQYCLLVSMRSSLIGCGPASLCASLRRIWINCRHASVVVL